MILAACAFGTLFFYVNSPVVQVGSIVVRRGFMGLAMAVTAILIISSPFGKRSGAVDLMEKA